MWMQTTDLRVGTSLKLGQFVYLQRLCNWVQERVNWPLFGWLEQYTGKICSCWPLFLSCGRGGREIQFPKEREDRFCPKENQRLGYPESVEPPVSFHSRSPALFLSLSSKIYPCILIINSSFLLKLTQLSFSSFQFKESCLIYHLSNPISKVYLPSELHYSSNFILSFFPLLFSLSIFFQEIETCPVLTTKNIFSGVRLSEKCGRMTRR